MSERSTSVVIAHPVCGMMHIKEPLLLIGKSSLCGGSGFPLSLSEWSLTICLTMYIYYNNVIIIIITILLAVAAVVFSSSSSSSNSSSSSSSSSSSCSSKFINYLLLTDKTLFLSTIR